MHRYSAISFFCLLVSLTLSAQVPFYVSDISFSNTQLDDLKSSFVISGNHIVFNAANYQLYAIRKNDGKINWQTYIGWKSDTPPYLYDAILFCGNYENEIKSCAQYSLIAGELIKKLPFEPINTKPYFASGILYFTALMDGGKLLAYNPEENKVIWQKFIGHGIDSRPVYLKNKIIASAENNKWFETDYSGNVLKINSKQTMELDETPVSIKNYQFLSHDLKEITEEFLNKNLKPYTAYKTHIAENQTYIFTENEVLVLGNRKKILLKVDLENLLPTSDFDIDAYENIIETSDDRFWFCYQNYLVHYDVKNNKLLRKVDLTRWNPHQVVLDTRTIWLISKNDGQLYGLDFEPDKKAADFIKAKAERQRETDHPKPPDPEKIKAAKAAQENLNNKN